MDSVRKAFFLFVLLTLFIGGCLGIKKPIRKIDYYTLEYDPPKVMEFSSLPFVIRIDRFSVAPLYNSNRIVYREKQFKRDTYNYHKWHANPGDLVTYFLARDMRQSSLFKGVIVLNSRMSSSHIIEGTVDEFFEQDNKDLWEGVLSVNIALMTENEPDISRSILFQKRYSVREPCRQKNPRALAEAMSRAMSRISGMIISDVYGCLAKIKG
ncbi:MAG: membrane integrity-associated transporter subunit PqiC [Desulfobacterales bacterium]|nr:membrane integrity-associated transporter subunit PqiC [Desulfobacterales bacterium]